MTWSDCLDFLAMPFKFFVNLLADVSWQEGVTLLGVLTIIIVTSAVITYYGR